MKRIILLVLFLICTNCALGQDGGCIIDDDPHLNWALGAYQNDPINDDGSVNIELGYQDPLTIECVDCKYIDARTEGGKLIFFTTSEFANFDKNEVISGGNEKEFISTFKLTCQTQTNLAFMQTVRDVNNHVPTFITSSPYGLTLPIPILPGVDITSFGTTQIIVEDLDFSNDKITFSVDNANFIVDSTTSPTNPKQFIASIKTTQPFYIYDSLILTLTAMDNGSPQSQSDPWPITITIDKANSVPESPKFSLPSYNYDYIETDGVPSLELKGGEITITSSSLDNTEVTVEGGAPDQFTVTKPDPTSGIVTLGITSTIQDSVSSVLILTLTTKLTDFDPTSQSVAVINLPSELVITIPKFSEIFYTATYTIIDGTHSVTIDDGKQITVTQDATNAEVKITGDNSQYFMLTPSSGAWDLGLTGNLPTDILDAGKELTLTLEANYIGSIEIGLGVLIINLPLPSATPSFTEPYYTATYSTVSDPHTVTVDEGKIIELTQNTDKSEVILTGTNAEYFKLTLNVNKWELSVQSNLPQGVLDAGKELTLTLDAKYAGDTVHGYGVLIINLPPPSATPSFTEPYYTATYSTVSDPHTVTVDGGKIIELTQNTGNSEVSLIGTNAESFKLDLNVDKWELGVLTNLPQGVLDAGKELTLTLDANYAGGTVHGLGVLIINLPPVSSTVQPPKFTQIRYKGDYKESGGNYIVELPEAIKVDVDANPSFEINTVDTYSTNFKINYLSTPQIEVLLPLDDSILNSETQILIILVAAISETTDLGSAVIELRLPPLDLPTLPKFSKPSYSVLYKIDPDNSDTIDLNGEVITLSNDDGTIIITSESYTSNFEFERNVANNDYSIKVLADLDGTVFEENAYLLINLVAKQNGNSVDSATLFITLTQGTSGVPPKFSATYYTADYQINDPDLDSITLTNGPITVSRSDEITTEIQGDQASHFDITPTGNELEISVKQDLDQSTIEKQNVVLVLVATLTDGLTQGFATIVITLPKSSASTIPQFTSVLYTGDYKTDTAVHTVVLDAGQLIGIVGDTTGATTVAVVGTYEPNFSVSYDTDSKSYLINVEANLGDVIINTESAIIVTLEANVDGTIERGLANLQLKMPESTGDIMPEFSKIYYTAVYAVDETNTDTIQITSEAITITSQQSAETQVQIAQPYNTSFKIEWVDPAWQLSVLQDLDSTILENNEIVIVLHATLNGSPNLGIATVIVDLPKKTMAHAPKFSHTYYSAEYKIVGTDHSITMVGDTISILGNDEPLVQVTLVGTYKDNFELTHDTTNHLWNIGIVTPLGDDVLNSEKELMLELEGALDGAQSGFATLLIKLPGTTIVTFDKPYYEATYNVVEGGTDTVTSDPIKLSESADIVSVTGEYEPNFQITCVGSDCTLEVKGNLDDSIINSQPEVLIGLEASKTGQADRGTATVLIKLPARSNSMMFSKNVYTATYSLGEPNDNVALDTVIELPSEDITNIDLALQDYDQTFMLTKQTDNWILSVKADLPQDTLDQEVALLLPVKATETSGTRTGTTSIVVKLPKQSLSSISFTQPLYESDYVVGPPDHLDNAEVIQIQADDLNVVTVTQSGLYSTYFTSSYDTATGTVSVIVKENLPPGIIDGNVMTILDLDAKVSGVVVASAGFVVKFPRKIVASPISFSEPVYKSSYTDGNPPTLNVDEDIIISGPNRESARISLTGDYASYFSFNYDAPNGIVTITIDQLTSEILNEQSAISVNINAELDGVTITSGLVVALPPHVIPKSIGFEKEVYMSTYKPPMSFEISGIIKVIGPGVNAATVTLLGTYQDHFDSNYNQGSGVLTVTLTDDFSDDILDQYSAITLTLEATSGTDVVVAGLIVEFPVRVVDYPIEFSEVAYESTYSVKNGQPSLILDEVISFDAINVQSVTVDINGDYESYFTVSQSNGTVSVGPKLLPDTILKKGVITVHIEAHLDQYTVETALVVKLPLSQVTPDPGSTDTTGFIVAISLLSVLLVGGIVGATAFFFIRRRRNRYNDPDIAKEERFSKNPKMSEVKRFETHPPRRPTKLLDFDETMPKETSTDFEEIPDRRKSVVFDENVEELPIEARNPDKDSESGSDDEANDNLSSDEENRNEDRKNDDNGSENARNSGDEEQRTFEDDDKSDRIIV